MVRRLADEGEAIDDVRAFEALAGIAHVGSDNGMAPPGSDDERFDDVSVAASGGGPTLVTGSGPAAAQTPTPSHAEINSAATDALVGAVLRRNGLRTTITEAAIQEVVGKALNGAELRRGLKTHDLDDDNASVQSEDSGAAAVNYTKVPTFEKTKSYSGLRIGRVFKLGLAGLGYYADNGPVVQVNLLKGLYPADCY